MNRISVFTFVLVSVFLYSFKPKKEKKTEFSASLIEEQFAYIPSGYFNYWEVFDSTYSVDFTPISYSTKAFYLSKYEISNELYLRFVLEQKNEELLKSVLPDTLCWKSEYVSDEKYIDYYFRHPAYAEWPVVGVSYEQAVLFCDWLTKCYNSFEKRKFKKVVFRLPTKYEWFRAASNRVNSTFPWESSSLLNEKGHMNAAFKLMNQRCILNNGTVIQEFDDTGYSDIIKYQKRTKKSKIKSDPYFDLADPIVPIQFFEANAFGLYNMAGNVREMLAEKGYTKGGGWKDTGFYLRNCVMQTMNESSRNDVGFRPVMEVLETYE